MSAVADGSARRTDWCVVLYTEVDDQCDKLAKRRQF